MNKIFTIVGLIGLALTIVPPVMLFVGAIGSLPTTKNLMVAGMALWFVGATPVLGLRKLEPADLEVEI